MTYIPYPTAGALERTGHPIGPQADLFALSPFELFTQDFVFLGDTLPAEIVSVTNGTSAALTPTATTSRGLGLVTGTDDNGYAGIALALAYKGDLGLLAEYWLELPADITTLKVEAGVTDATADAGAVNVKATPTATATDYGVFVFDTDDDTALAFHSAKAGTIVATEGVDTLSASDKLYMAVRVQGDNVEAYYQANSMRSPVKVAVHGGSAGIEGGSALTPWVFAQARAGAASRTVTLLRARITGALV